MALHRVHIKAFGKMKDVKLAFGPGINLIFGQNEAGKSTLVSAIISLLMGFSPAKVDTHPYAPWDQNGIDLEAEIISDRETVLIQRTLRSNPSGSLFSGLQREKLNNLPLPSYQFISREVFSAVFSMKHDQLNGELLKTKSWQEIKEHFMFSLAQEAICSPSKVLERLDNEKKSLLKQDNRGSQKIKTLTKDIKIKKAELKESAEGFANYEQRVVALEQQKTELEGIKVQLTARRLESEELDRILPHKHLDRQIQAMLNRFPLLNQLTDIKRALFIEKELQPLYENQRQSEGQLLEDKDALLLMESQELTYTEKEKQLLSDREAYHDLIGRRDQIRTLRQKNLMDRNEIDSIDENLKLQFMETFQNTYTADCEVALQKIDLSALSAGFQDLKSLRSRVDPEPQHKAHTGIMEILLACMLWGVTCLLVLFYKLPVALAISVLCIVSLALVLSLLLFRQLKASEAKRKQLAEGMNRHREQGEVVSALLALLQPLIRDQAHVLSLGDGFVQQVIQLKSQLDKKALRLDQLAQDRIILEAYDARLKVFENKHLMTLDASMALMESMEIKSVKMQVDREKCTFIEARILESSKRLALLDEKILVGQNEIEKLVQCQYDVFKIEASTLNENLKKLEELIQERESLELAEVRQPLLSEMTYEQLLEERDSVLGDLMRLKAAETRLYGDIRAEEIQCNHLREKDHYLDQISALSIMETALEEAKETYAQIAILIELIRHTDEVYKALYQPTYLKQASAYFRQITGNRYTEILIDDRDWVLLKRVGQEMPLESLQSLSSGTLNQLYFSLFLSLTDVLDPTGLLPLFLDDVFICRDSDRFDAGVEVVKQLATKRQVFLMSCNQDYARRIQLAFNIEPVTLML